MPSWKDLVKNEIYVEDISWNTTLKTFETEFELSILMANSCLQSVYQTKRTSISSHTLKKKKDEVQNHFHGLVTNLKLSNLFSFPKVNICIFSFFIWVIFMFSFHTHVMLDLLGSFLRFSFKPRKWILFRIKICLIGYSSCEISLDQKIMQICYERCSIKLFYLGALASISC